MTNTELIICIIVTLVVLFVLIALPFILARELMDEAHKTAKHLGAKVTALVWSLKESPYWVIEWYTRLGYDEKGIGNGCALMKRPLTNK